MKRKIIILFVLFSFFFVPKTYAAPKQLTITKSEILSGLVTNQKQGFTVFTAKETGNNIVYCIDIDKKPLSNNDIAYLTNDKLSTDQGLYYILNNGYPTKRITGKDETDKYITQASVWWYLDENKLADSFKNATSETDVYGLIPNYIKPMVNKAKTYQKNDNLNLKVINDKDYLTLSDNYYESDLISVSTNGTNYKVETNDLDVLDESNNIKDIFSNGEKFKVRINKDKISQNKTFKINVIALSKEKNVRIYQTKNNELQRIAVLLDDDISKTTSIDLKVNPNIKYICEFKNGKYYNKNGQETDQKSFNQECKEHTCEIIDNTYYGRNGDIIDKNTFDKDCSQEVNAPNTASNIVISSVVLGCTIIVLGTTIMCLKINKSKRRNK